MTGSRLVVVLVSLAIVVAGLVLAASAQLPAPGAAPGQAGRPLAVVDVKQLFDNSTRFKAALADIQADAQRADALIRQENQALVDMAKRLQGLSPQSAEYRTLAQEVAKRQQDLRVRLDVEKKSFEERQAAVLHAAYEQIHALVKDYAVKNRIAAVLNYHAALADPKKLAEVLQEVNRPVIFSGEELNITPAIQAALNGLPADWRPTASSAVPPEAGRS